jgi:hypothetical protein
MIASMPSRIAGRALAAILGLAAVAGGAPGCGNAGPKGGFAVAGGPDLGPVEGGAYYDNAPPGSNTWIGLAGEPAWVKAPPARAGHLRWVAEGKSNLRGIAAGRGRPSAEREAKADLASRLAPALGADGAARVADAVVPARLVLVHRAVLEEILTRDLVPGNTLCTAWALWELPVDAVVEAAPAEARAAVREALGPR